MSNESQKLCKLPLHHIRSYLELEEWSLVNENARWLVYENKNSAEIALPKNTKAPDYHVYVGHILKKLSRTQDKDPESVADDILSYDLDIFGVIVDRTEYISSIPMRNATVVFSELRQLISYSATSDLKAEPYFKNIPEKARKMLDHFQFGHTVRGSFGYRIESKIKIEPLVQLKLFDQEPETVRTPERRVMERIVNGLVATEMAAKTGDIRPLTEGYSEGLNANMCTALIRMTEEARDDLEYWVKWSKKVKVSRELRHISKIRIGRTHREYLEEASEHLYRQDPEYVSIFGYVTELSQVGPDRDVLGAGAITIQRLTPEGRTQKVHVVVDEKAHSKAVDAYREGRTVGVNGYLEYKSQKWRLTNPEKFRIVS